MHKQQMQTQKLVIVSMLCALSYVVMLVGRVPVVLFLKYDPKDVLITLGGFLFDPLTALLISAVVSCIEMFTASDTGVIGCIMNIVSTCSFACMASWIYARKRTFSSALLGLGAGWLTMTAAMLLWNYLLTPLYMGYPREAVMELLLPAFLPFNLLKGGLNAALTLLLYKPVVSALRKAKLLPARVPMQESTGEAPPRLFRVWPMLLGGMLLVICILLLLSFKGII